MFWVYAIKSRKCGRIYIGQTINLDKRLSTHNKGQVKSTQRDRPWFLIACECCETRDQTRWKEFNLKKSRGKRLKWLEEFSTGLRPGGRDGENSETETWLNFAKDCGYLSIEDHVHLSAQCRSVGKMIGSMLKNPESFIQKP